MKTPRVISHSPRHAILGSLLSLALLPASSKAASVLFAGVINDDASSEISQWKTASTAKTFDVDGDNFYGTLAHLFYQIEFKGQNTLYTFDGSDSQVGPFGGYATVDHPAGDGTTPGDIQVRTTSNGGGGGSDHVMFTFTALAGSPANVRIGIATDGLNDPGYASASIGLRQVGASSSEHTMTSTNNILDMVFFNVTGVAAGDQFQIFADTGAFGYATHQFVTWDALPTSFVWDGSAGTWSSAHWNAGAGLVSGPGGASNSNYATINSGTVTFAQNDTFGNHVTPSSSVITVNSGGTLASGGFFNTIWNLKLNGGTLLANGGVNNPYGAFQLAGTVTIGGSVASNISAGAGSFNTVSLGNNTGFTTFNVADVTNSAATDLTISTVLSEIASPSGLIKTGAGTMTLTAANTYTGDTNVNGGQLNLNGTLGAGANVVNANAGVTNFGVSETLGALNIADGAVVTLGAPAAAPAASFDNECMVGGATQAVPEPGSAGLLLGGLATLVGLRRRKV